MILVDFSAALPKVELKSRRTCFWRHQRGSPDTYLATIEAVYYFLKDLHSHYLPPYEGEYDNLLFFFSFLYKLINKAKQTSGKTQTSGALQLRWRLVLFHRWIHQFFKSSDVFIYKSEIACNFWCSQYDLLNWETGLFLRHLCVIIKQISRLMVNQWLTSLMLASHGRSAWRLSVALQCWVCRWWGYQRLRIPHQEFTSWQSAAHTHTHVSTTTNAAFPTNPPLNRSTENSRWTHNTGMKYL